MVLWFYGFMVLTILISTIADRQV